MISASKASEIADRQRCRQELSEIDMEVQSASYQGRKYCTIPYILQEHMETLEQLRYCIARVDEHGVDVVVISWHGV